MKLTTTLLATTALTVAAVSAHAQDMANSLTLVSWGGAYQNSQQKAYVEPYLANNPDVTITWDESSAEAVAKLRAMDEAGNVTWDLVDVVASDANAPLTARTVVEDNKLRRRPESWRLACQALVEQSVIVLTRPQVRLAEMDKKKAAACAEVLPAGPTAWPVDESANDSEERSEQETATDSPATPSDEG